jgi:hypothetical protein
LFRGAKSISTCAPHMASGNRDLPVVWGRLMYSFHDGGGVDFPSRTAHTPTLPPPKKIFPKLADERGGQGGGDKQGMEAGAGQRK